ncbi:MAG: hypothetical protein AB8B51_08795 [Sedimentitalea sp.]
MPRLVAWVEATENRVWIKRHGKLAGALVPNSDCQALDRWEGRSLAEQKRRMDELWERWQRVKSGGEVDHLPEGFWYGR